MTKPELDATDSELDSEVFSLFCRSSAAVAAKMLMCVQDNDIESMSRITEIVEDSGSLDLVVRLPEDVILVVKDGDGEVACTVVGPALEHMDHLLKGEPVWQ